LKTIFYIGGFELPDKNAAAHRVLGNGKVLKSLGYRVVFIGVTKTYTEVTFHEYSGFDCYSIPYPSSTIKWIRFIAMKSEYLDIMNKYDYQSAIIAYNQPALSTYRLMRYCKLHELKIYLDLTEWFKGQFKQNFVLDTIKTIDNYFRIKVLTRKVDGVIAISKHFSDVMTQNNAKHVLVPPLVDSTDMKWRNNEANQSTVRKYIYAGGAFSVKYSNSVKDRLDLVIDALHKLHAEGFDFLFHIIGCTKEEFLLVFEDKTKIIHELNNRIKFHGKREHGYVLDLLRTSDFSIFLRDETISTKAGFPSKFVESISIGLPVITNANSNVKDYLIDGVNGYCIERLEPDNIVKKIRISLTIKDSEIVEMKKRTKASNLFDYRNFENQFKKLLNIE